jgi:hypothetical protein
LRATKAKKPRRYNPASEEEIMTEDQGRDVLIDKDAKGSPRGIGAQFKLILRLLRDNRVSPLLKALPILAGVYLISPLDSFLPVVDDAVIVGLGLYTFVELCPPEIVAEHRAALAAEEQAKAS